MNSVFLPGSPGVVPSKTCTTSFKRNAYPLCTATMLSACLGCSIASLLHRKITQATITTKHFAKIRRRQVYSFVRHVSVFPLSSLSFNLIFSQSNHCAKKLRYFLCRAARLKTTTLNIQTHLTNCHKAPKNHYPSAHSPPTYTTNIQSKTQSV